VKAFVGGSQKNRALLNTVHQWLQGTGISSMTWNDLDAFKAGTSSIFERLLQIAMQIDAAILIFSADEAVTIDGETKWLPSANVVFECGLFLGALSSSRVLVCRAGQAKIPSDLAGVTYIDFEDDRAERRFVEWTRQRRGERLHQAFATFPTDEFAKRVGTAKRVAILQTFIPNDLQLEILMPELRAAIDEHGVELRVLICDPRAKSTIRTRSETLGFSEDRILTEVTRNVLSFGEIYRALRPNNRERLAVRVHSTLPPVCAYMVDDEIVFGCYFHQRLAIAGPQMRIIGAEGSWAAALKAEFEAIWNHAANRTVALEDPLQWLRC
jgi:hypothetical protein